MELYPVNGLGGIEGQSPESVDKSIDALYDTYGWNKDKQPTTNESDIWKDFDNTTGKSEVR